MASFTNRGTKSKPSWQYTVSAKPKPIRKGGFRTKKEAEVAAAEVESKLRKGITPRLKLEPFNDYYINWVKVYKTGVVKNTYQRYLDTHKTIDNYFGDKPIQHITKREYQKFLNEFGKTRARQTTRKLNSHIRACVKDAIDEGVIFMDFTRKVTITGREAKRTEDKHLNYEESKQLYDYLINNLDRGLFYYLLLLGLVTGMRFGELVGLTRKDFVFFNNTVNIDKTWGYTKKMHDGFGETKNVQSIRQISVDEVVMKKFKKLFENTPENIHKLVFYSPSSKYKVLSNGGANKMLQSILKKLGIDTITVHGLRHTHASVSLYKKASINYVAERLGHSDIYETYKTYSHILKEMREDDEKITVRIYTS